MAEITANEVAQRYAVIEQAYSKEKWATVLHDGEDLLQHLRPSDNPQLMGLQMRLQLLLGHTQLYGYTDKSAASGYYGAVAAQSSETALTRIAEQGLKLCAIEGLSAEQAPAQTATPAVVPTTGGPGPAAPWITAAAATAITAETAASAPATLAEPETQPVTEAAVARSPAPWSSGPSLIPEVVEEPELIELHQADPTLAEDVELAWKEEAPATSSVDQADEDLLSGLMLVRLG